MMKNKFCIFFCTVNMIIFSAHAQIASPPSLAVGLSGLVGEKGNIDVQLLSEIVSQKQDELKKEGIRRIMNNAVLNHSYALWDFTNHTLEMLLYSKDKKAIEKELAEYATNMVLVYGFAEAYLQASYQLGNSHLLGTMENYPNLNLRTTESYKEYIKVLKKSTNGDKSLKESKLFWLAKLKLEKNEKPANTETNFNSFFLDLVYDVLKENKTIHSFGFFAEPEMVNEDVYRAHNRFYIMMKDSTNRQFIQYADSLKARINEELEVFINNYYIMRVTYFQNLSINKIFNRLSNNAITPGLADMFSNSDSVRSDFLKSIRNISIEHILAVSDSIASTVRRNQNLKTALNTDSLAIELSNCINFFRHLKAVADTDLTNQDYLFVREKALPLYLQLNMEYGIGQSYIEEMRRVVNFIYAKNIEKIQSDLKNLQYSTGLADLPLDRLFDFVKLLTELHQLDKANTYDFVFNNIKQVSNLLPEGTAKTFLSVITDNIERFTLINTEENRIEIDVEEVLLQLYKRYAEQNTSTFKFYLSLGLNQTLNIHYKDSIYELKESDDTSAATLQSLSFASEKVGIKCSFFTGKKRTDGERNLNFKTNEPLVSDLHVLVFGSGILYNIINSKTSKNFTYPMVGFGAGISFFNGLDANLFMAVPLLSNEHFDESFKRRQLYGFSFDIKFMEYIQALRKKRTEQKTSSN